MPRPARAAPGGFVYHALNRVVARLPLFQKDEVKKRSASPFYSQRLLSDPLLHAADYYALANGNINLDNYQALTNHFPIKFKEGHLPSIHESVDTIIIWDQPPDRFKHLLQGFRPCLFTKRLAIFQKNWPSRKIPRERKLAG